MNFLYTAILSISIIIAGEAKLDILSANKKNIYLHIESEEDLYGIQFEILYKPSEVFLNEDAIISKVEGIKIYTNKKEDDRYAVLMLGFPGENHMLANHGIITEIIEIQFNPVEKFRGSSFGEIDEIILAGKAGVAIELSDSSINSFELSFLKPIVSSLSKNHPNPFNSTTSIDYTLSEAGMVSLVIYDLEGTLIKTLTDDYQEKDYHTIIWNGMNEDRQPIENGRYILKMSTSGFSDSIIMTLLK
ncbi:uncharacterized protein METZ01_LOCUS377430 [marine metagenome]|uniref:FlgD/Vpr Ig-like domain-containing protein n=1 Tax=marine metagenome TaxID=408172 RepID=A0A382TR66_9ZZZZ